MDYEDTWNKIHGDGEDQCRHRNVIPTVIYPDGSVDGRCVDCGTTGFPIRDVQYEIALLVVPEMCPLARGTRYQRHLTRTRRLQQARKLAKHALEESRRLYPLLPVTQYTYVDSSELDPEVPF